MDQPEIKKCKTCQIEKPVSEFYKTRNRYKGREYVNHQTYCKECAKARYSQQARENPERTKRAVKAWRDNNPDKAKASVKRWQEAHKAELKAYRKVYHAEKMQTDENYKIAVLLRARMNRTVSKEAKAGSAVRDLGCSVNEFKTHLEKQFRPGMTWENRGEWQIDHIIPLSAFDLTDRAEFLIACHYLNLQPMWKKDNQEKHDKMPDLETLDSLVKSIGVARGFIPNSDSE